MNPLILSTLITCTTPNLLFFTFDQGKLLSSEWYGLYHYAGTSTILHAQDESVQPLPTAIDISYHSTRVGPETTWNFQLPDGAAVFLSQRSYTYSSYPQRTDPISGSVTLPNGEQVPVKCK